MLLVLLLSTPVFAQEATEGRIAEHNVVSIIAFVGLITVVQIIRKKRKSITQEN